jgi:hypothetical protein
MPCSDHAVLLKATAQRSRRETACGPPARYRLLPATKRSSTKVVISNTPLSDAGGQCETITFVMDEEKSGAAHYKKDALLNCRTGSSDISGYHADFHEGQGTVGAGQGCGMACVN